MASVLAWISGSGVVQGVIIGATLAFLTAIVVMDVVGRKITTTVNGWNSVPRVGQPGNGVLVRAAAAKALPAVNVFEEAAYWTTTRDGSGQPLNGAHRYLLSFPAGHLPPVDAFWSLTVTDAVGYIVSGPTRRSSVNDRSNLAENDDGAIDILVQHDPPIGREQNWLPAPSGKFKLTLRAYLPGDAILDGTYRVPPVVRVR